MSDFLVTEAIDEDEIQNEEKEHEGNDFISTLSDEEFIDDESQFEDQNASDYYRFTNIERSYDDAIQDSLTDFDFNQEANNYNYDDDDLKETVDNFKDFEARVFKFKKTLFCPQELQNEDSFFYSILYAVRYHFTKKYDNVKDDEIKKDIPKIFDEIYPLKEFLKLDSNISTFENQCYTINHILNKNNLFLRIFEQKDKFRYITNTTKDRKKLSGKFQHVLKKNLMGLLSLELILIRK